MVSVIEIALEQLRKKLDQEAILARYVILQRCNLGRIVQARATSTASMVNGILGENGAHAVLLAVRMARELETGPHWRQHIVVFQQKAQPTNMRGARPLRLAKGMLIANGLVGALGRTAKAHATASGRDNVQLLSKLLLEVGLVTAAPLNWANVILLPKSLSLLIVHCPLARFNASNQIGQNGPLAPGLVRVAIRIAAEVSSRASLDLKQQVTAMLHWRS